MVIQTDILMDTPMDTSRMGTPMLELIIMVNGILSVITRSGRPLTSDLEKLLNELLGTKQTDIKSLFCCFCKKNIKDKEMMLKQNAGMQLNFTHS